MMALGEVRGLSYDMRRHAFTTAYHEARMLCTVYCTLQQVLRRD